MAVEMTVELRSIEGTRACAGWAGTHSITVYRPADKAGGEGRGFNGGQLLALAIGGCFCNDLHYAAHDMGVILTRVAVDVTLTLDGSPLIATGATMRALEIWSLVRSSWSCWRWYSASLARRSASACTTVARARRFSRSNAISVCLTALSSSSSLRLWVYCWRSSRAETANS